MHKLHDMHERNYSYYLLVLLFDLIKLCEYVSIIPSHLIALKCFFHIYGLKMYSITRIQNSFNHVYKRVTKMNILHILLIIKSKMCYIFHEMKAKFKQGVF